MKKATILLILILSLIAGAFALAPLEAAAKCNAPNCFASPGCCADRHCDAFCGGAGLGFCGPSQCCTCQG